MKFAIVLFLLSIIGSVPCVTRGQESLSISSPKNSYSLGERVPLKIAVVNGGSETVNLRNCFEVTSGEIKILISRDTGPFRKYSHSKWGVADKNCPPTPVSPGNRVKTSATLLWNFVPDVTNIAELAREQLVTSYAFPVVGTYSLKVAYVAYFSGTPVELTCDPINITVVEPIGDEQRVWVAIKNRSDLAYFIQEGDFLTYDLEKRKELLTEIGILHERYPDSTILSSVEDHIRKFRILMFGTKAYEPLPLRRDSARGILSEYGQGDLCKSGRWGRAGWRFRRLGWGAWGSATGSGRGSLRRRESRSFVRHMTGA